ncbi:MAG: galactose-1-epimerase, partial [Ruminococcaceae bacterium]|nr:galactose-1-epimerase [Oscillospiraceae bacterium]
MSIQKAEFANYNGEKVYAYTLCNANGLSAEILNYGGIVKNLWVPDKKGKCIDVALGFDTFEDYLDNDGYYGALVGRCANRIEKGMFSIKGTEYQASINDGENSLHGGVGGFHRHLWEADMLDGDSPSLVLRTVSPDGEDGFPG